MSQFEYAVGDQIVFKIDGELWAGKIVNIYEDRDWRYSIVPWGRTIPWGVRAPEVLGKLRGAAADSAALRARIAELEGELEKARQIDTARGSWRERIGRRYSDGTGGYYYGCVPVKDAPLVLPHIEVRLPEPTEPVLYGLWWEDNDASCGWWSPHGEPWHTQHLGLIRAYARTLDGACFVRIIGPDGRPLALESEEA